MTTKGGAEHCTVSVNDVHAAVRTTHAPAARIGLIAPPRSPLTGPYRPAAIVARRTVRWVGRRRHGRRNFRNRLACIAVIDNTRHG
jgi:hypothetical protein